MVPRRHKRSIEQYSSHQNVWCLGLVSDQGGSGPLDPYWPFSTQKWLNNEAIWQRIMKLIHSSKSSSGWGIDQSDPGSREDLPGINQRNRTRQWNNIQDLITLKIYTEGKSNRPFPIMLQIRSSVLFKNLAGQATTLHFFNMQYLRHKR